MGSENKRFNFRLWIKDKESEEIIELSKSDYLKVEWEEGLGKAEKKVVFEKNSKDYEVLVKVLLTKFLLGIRDNVIKYKFFVPSNAPYEVYGGYRGEPGNSPEKDIERQEVLKLTNEWNRGRIIVFLGLLVITIIFIWAFSKKKEKKQSLISRS